MIIKQKEKGCTIVIMDKDHNRNMAFDQLNNYEFYAELPNCQDRKTATKLRKFTSKFSTSLTKKKQEYLLKFEVKVATFMNFLKFTNRKR